MFKNTPTWKTAGLPNAQKQRERQPKQDGQEKAPDEEGSEVEASSLPDTGVKTAVTRVVRKLRGKTNELSDNFNRERESKHKKPPEKPFLKSQK